MDDRRVRLEKLRDRLDAAMDEGSTRSLPQLAAQYRATLADLAALPAVAPDRPVEGSVLDFKSRRAEQQGRVEAATVGASARKKGVKSGA